MGSGASKHEEAAPQEKEGRLLSSSKRPDLLMGLRPVLLVEKAAQERQNDDGERSPPPLLPTFITPQPLPTSLPPSLPLSLPPSRPC